MRFFVFLKKINLSGSFPKIRLLESGGSCTFYKSSEKNIPTKITTVHEHDPSLWLDSLCPPLGTGISLTERLENTPCPAPPSHPHCCPLCSPGSAGPPASVCPNNIPSLPSCPHPAHSCHVCQPLSQMSTGASGRTKSVCVSVLSGQQVVGESAGQAGRGFFFSGQTAIGMLSRSNVTWSRVVRGTGLSEMVCGQQVRKDRWTPGQSLLERSLKAPQPREKVTCTLRSGGSKRRRRDGDFEPRRCGSCSWAHEASTCSEAVAGPPSKAQLVRGVLAWHLWTGADHEDAKTGEDHAGGHSTDEDLEGHHHLLCLLAGSCLIPRKLKTERGDAQGPCARELSEEDVG